MNFINYLHFFFIFILLLTSIFLIVSKNPVYSVLFLILNFFSAASILIIFKVDFLGLLLIVVYVGAIAVLFLFVVMMLNLKTEVFILYDLYKFLIAIFFISIALFWGLFKLNIIDIFQKKFIYQDAFSAIIESLSNIDVFAQCLYNYFLPCFLIGGLILLLAMLGAISLTMKSSSNRKNQIVSKQLSRSSNCLTFLD